MSRFFSTGILLWCCLCMLLACSREKGIAGKSGVDETSNGLTAFVADSSGNPESDALVIVRPVHYRPDGSLHTTHPELGYYTLITDRKGQFHLDSLPAGDYKIEIRSTDQGTLLDLHVDSIGLTDNALADTLQISPLGSVVGKVQLPPGVPYAQIVIEGTELMIVTDSLGNFHLENVPEGSLNLIAFSPNQQVVLAEIVVNVASGLESDLGTLDAPAADLQQWAYSMNVVLNTRASGVSLPKRLLDYPLLVRLEGANFPLEATEEGADIRILDTAGNPLAFSISHWDPLSRKAQLWIKLPRVEVDDSLVVAMIRWGRSGALPVQQPEVVFDTTDGWVASFALQSRFQDSLGSLVTSDATANHLQGIVLDGTDYPVFSADGAWFDSTSNGIGIGGLPLNFGGSNYTISAWVKPEMPGSIWLSRGNRSDSIWNHGERAYYFGKQGTSVSAANGFQPAVVSHGLSTNQYVFATDTIAASSWVYMTVRRRVVAGDTATVQLFVNGSAVSTTRDTVVEELDRDRDSLYIGGPMFGRSFRGSVRQLQISRGIRSAEWIYFSSRTQMSDNPAIQLYRNQ